MKIHMHLQKKSNLKLRETLCSQQPPGLGSRVSAAAVAPATQGCRTVRGVGQKAMSVGEGERALGVPSPGPCGDTGQAGVGAAASSCPPAVTRPASCGSSVIPVPTARPSSPASPGEPPRSPGKGEKTISQRNLGLPFPLWSVLGSPREPPGGRLTGPCPLLSRSRDGVLGASPRLAKLAEPTRRSTPRCS